MLKALKIISLILALIGVPMSIMEIGMFGDVFGLIFCWFCLFIIFWFYLANVVFRPTSKKERRNIAYRKVVRRKNDHSSNNR